ncbi:uncharacterized protein BO80DRAFT_215250 [Aspergillus ibericus CBS 121593]|uniref:Uncharacterized protein n=1 Tax=Aspergillus ibericus CBS 121593 TaxID=1448316 RepID=A0A395GNJ4_9EURO|nr:hypothetical protein BO80DRAFT_215250 [Aspergillus ibericus CBS 121593]RAK96922.1 hypothetical protein BO80DRAFT_215250 [Aspergillus ibericus CBS 121593]
MHQSVRYPRTPDRGHGDVDLPSNPMQKNTVVVARNLRVGMGATAILLSSLISGIELTPNMAGSDRLAGKSPDPPRKCPTVKQRNAPGEKRRGLGSPISPVDRLASAASSLTGCVGCAWACAGASPWMDGCTGSHPSTSQASHKNLRGMREITMISLLPCSLCSPRILPSGFLHPGSGSPNAE